MASKVFDGQCSIVMNTKGEIALRKDVDGKFSAANAAECYKTMLALAKAKKATINQYSFWSVEKGTEPVLLANRYGNPYLALLVKQSEGDGKPSSRKVTKLA